MDGYSTVVVKVDGRVGRGKGLPWKGLTPASTYYYIYLLYLIHFGQLIIGHILVIYQSIVISHISVVFHSYIKQHEWMTNVLNALSIKEKIYIYWQNAQAWKSGGSTSNLLESPILLSVTKICVHCSQPSHTLQPTLYLAAVPLFLGWWSHGYKDHLAADWMSFKMF